MIKWPKLQRRSKKFHWGFLNDSKTPLTWRLLYLVQGEEAKRKIERQWKVDNTRGKKMEGRAQTAAEKRVVIERLYKVWAANPHYRLGQLISNAAPNLFYIEDEGLAEAVEGIDSGRERT